VRAVAGTRHGRALPPAARRSRAGPAEPALLRRVPPAAPAAARRRRGRAAAGTPGFATSRPVAACPRRSHRADRAPPLKIDTVADRCEAILAALAQVVVGKTGVLEQILAGVLANGHVLI